MLGAMPGTQEVLDKYKLFIIIVVIVVIIITLQASLSFQKFAFRWW